MQHKIEVNNLESELQSLIREITEETQAKVLTEDMAGSVESEDLLNNTAQETYSPEMLFKKAAERGYLTSLIWLVENKKVDPGVDNNYAIRHAAKNGHSAVVSWLLKDERVAPDALDNTPIGVAAEEGHYDVVEQLLADSRVSPQADNNYAIKRAAINGHTATVMLLMKDSRVVPAEYRTCQIHWATLIKCPALIQILLQDGSNDPNIGIREYYSPIERVVDNNDADTLLLLLQDKRVIISEKAFLNIIIRADHEVYRTLFLNKPESKQSFLPLIFFIEERIVPYLWHLKKFISKFLIILPDVLFPQGMDEEQTRLNLMEKLELFLKQISEIRNLLSVKERDIDCNDERSRTMLQEKHKFLNQVEQFLYEKGVNLLPQYGCGENALDYWLTISSVSPYYDAARFYAFQYVYNGHIREGEGCTQSFINALSCCINEQNNFISLKRDGFVFDNYLLSAAGIKAEYHEINSLTPKLRTLLLQVVILLSVLEELKTLKSTHSSVVVHGMFSDSFANSPEVIDLSRRSAQFQNLHKPSMEYNKLEDFEEIINGRDNDKGLWDLVSNLQIEFKNPDLNQLIQAVSRISSNTPKIIALPENLNKIG